MNHAIMVQRQGGCRLCSWDEDGWMKLRASGCSLSHLAFVWFDWIGKKVESQPQGDGVPSVACARQSEMGRPRCMGMVGCSNQPSKPHHKRCSCDGAYLCAFTW